MISILLIVVGIIGAIIAVILLTKNEANENKKTDKKDISSSYVTQENKKSVTQKNDKNVPRKDIFNFMEFDRISDNMILQEKETKYTMVIQCKGINYDLMSEVEQMAVEEGFITFLNTLKYPIQLYVQARAIDLKKSMNIYKDSVSTLNEDFIKADADYKEVSNELNVDFNRIKEAKKEREKYAHILEYAQDITRYVERISLNKHVLQRKFYIVLSYYKSEVITTSTTQFTKAEIHDICYRELYTRAQSLIGALSSCSVQGKVLDSNELAELLYISYNRDDEKLLDIKTALESGFYRLYSVSKDVFQKKEEIMQKQVEEEAFRRVQDALLETMKLQKQKTQEQLIEEFEERTDREALNIINAAEVSRDEKEELSDIIAQNHVKGVEERKKERIKKQELMNKEKEMINTEDNKEIQEENTNEEINNADGTDADESIV